MTPRILIIGQSFGRGHAATADLFTDLAEGLVEQGLAVDVLTSAADGARASIERNADLTIRRVSRRGSLLLRRVPIVGGWLSLASLWLALVRWCLLTRQRYSHAIVLDTPHLLTLAALLLQARHGTAAIAWVMDRPLLQIQRLNPPSSLKSRLGGLLNRLQVVLFQRCTAVVPLGACMASTLQREGVKASKLHIIRTWDRDDLPQQAIPASTARQLADLPERFTVMYSGYAGAWHNFDPVLACVQALAFDPALQFLFVGEGPGIERVRRWCASHPQAQVIFRPYVAAEQRIASLCCGDVHLVCLKAEMLGTCVPSKLNAVLGLGRPVLVVAPPQCQAALDVTNSGAGFCTPSPEDLGDSVRLMMQSNSTSLKLRQHAIQIYELNHCRIACLKQWVNLVNAFSP